MKNLTKILGLFVLFFSFASISFASQGSVDEDLMDLVLDFEDHFVKNIQDIYDDIPPQQLEEMGLPDDLIPNNDFNVVYGEVDENAFYDPDDEANPNPYGNFINDGQNEGEWSQ